MQRIALVIGLYIRILTLQAKPQDLPGVNAVMVGTLLVSIVTYLLVSTTVYPLGESVFRALIDMGLLILVLRLGLRIVGHPARFVQGFSALCGVSALLNLASLPIFQALGSGSSEQTVSVELYFAGLFLHVWSVVAVGHVFRHCFDTRFAIGVLVAISYMIAVVVTSNVLFPHDVAPSGAYESVIE
ncbi:MAG: hypothetical protein AAF420_16285 [Pseudomonadota bacterium]